MSPINPLCLGDVAILCRWESTTITVSYDTPMDVIEAVKVKVNNYITTNSREWSGCSVNIDKMEYQNAIHIIVAVERMSLLSHPCCC